MARTKRTNESEGNGQQAVAPKDLFTVSLLLLVRQWGYGYELAAQIQRLGFDVARATVYRTMRQLEEEGFVSSAWDTTVAAGPARRMYTLTEAGEALLRSWTGVLDGYRRMLDSFLAMAGAAATPPLDPAPRQHNAKNDQQETDNRGE